VVLLVLTVGGGVAVHHHAHPWKWWHPRYAELALWGLGAFWLWLYFFPTMRTTRAVKCSLITSTLVELSQLYQAPWIHEVRLTPVGMVVLGAGFHPIDLVCYAAGVVVGSVLDDPFCIAEAAPKPQHGNPWG
jgi:hypothetical protein